MSVRNQSFYLRNESESFITTPTHSLIKKRHDLFPERKVMTERYLIDILIGFYRLIIWQCHLGFNRLITYWFIQLTDEIKYVK